MYLSGEEQSRCIVKNDEDCGEDEEVESEGYMEIDEIVVNLPVVRDQDLFFELAIERVWVFC